jgi:ribosome modulation factor
MEDRTPDVDKARAAGEIAGAEGKTRQPPYATGTAQEQAWLDGWATGQATLTSAFKKLEAKAAAAPADEDDESDEE